MGGSRNGGTWSDGTVYYEVVPTDALEKIFWIDSDRMGYMINTVTEEALERVAAEGVEISGHRYGSAG